MARYTLLSRDALRWITQHPGRGEPYTVRALASAAAVPQGTVGHLLTGRMTSLTEAQARALAAALGVGVRVLFDPAPSTNENTTEHTRAREESTSWSDAPRSHPRD
ncbi:hypothetical protein [Streptomyces sp. NPDC088923]|uniref:hypothetical protein n=1 Tax=Streptomyces sp. NPDC088923 TaxID=3365913 RepID=UPI003827A733